MKGSLSAAEVHKQYSEGVTAFRRQIADATLRVKFTQEADVFLRACALGVWQRDGASLIARMLFEEATDINFFVGRAINPAHQNPNLPINFNIKMRLVEELSECLKQMGKRIKVSYF